MPLRKCEDAEVSGNGNECLVVVAGPETFLAIASRGAAGCRCLVSAADSAVAAATDDVCMAGVTIGIFGRAAIEGARRFLAHPHGSSLLEAGAAVGAVAVTAFSDALSVGARIQLMRHDGTTVILDGFGGIGGQGGIPGVGFQSWVPLSSQFIETVEHGVATISAGRALSVSGLSVFLLGYWSGYGRDGRCD